MNRIVNTIILSLSLAFLSINHLLAKTDEFPGRLEFPDFPVIELHELRRQIDDVVVVDTRSAYEYQTLRIKGAIKMPVADKSFEEDLKKLADATSKPIVFYCNDRTCYKSYLAVKKGFQSGISNLAAYDAGVFEWTKTYPGIAVLLGNSPVDLSKLISKVN
ncbi:MAG: rhodanese-like domain-containing protein [Gammaproteobacteria bacterium]|nr:rhodanese-like domain-containing protein [Gammaproteobacteria bacterium]